MLYDDSEDEEGWKGRREARRPQSHATGEETAPGKAGSPLPLPGSPPAQAASLLSKAGPLLPSQCRSSSGDLWDCVICRELK